MDSNNIEPFKREQNEDVTNFEDLDYKTSSIVHLNNDDDNFKHSLTTDKKKRKLRLQSANPFGKKQSKQKSCKSLAQPSNQDYENDEVSDVISIDDVSKDDSMLDMNLAENKTYDNRDTNPRKNQTNEKLIEEKDV